MYINTIYCLLISALNMQYHARTRMHIKRDKLSHGLNHKNSLKIAQAILIY